MEWKCTPDFISVEGPDGAGKTTIIHNIQEWLNKETSQQIILTREPGGDNIAEEIRDIILSPKNTQMDALTEALLYASARRQHLATTILPALAQNKIVISDRYIDSSIAYQGYGRGLDVQEVRDLNMIATNGVLPQLTIYLDVPAQVGLKRIKKNRADNIDRLDAEELAFHQRVRKGYLELANEEQNRISVVNANRDIEEVQADIENLLEALIETKTFFD